MVHGVCTLNSPAAGLAAVLPNPKPEAAGFAALFAPPNPNPPLEELDLFPVGGGACMWYMG